MNGTNVEKVYRLAAKRERDRERKRRRARQGAFEADMLSLDALAQQGELQPSWISDGGAGAEAVVAACGGEAQGSGGAGGSHYARCVRSARERLRRAHPGLVEVFNLVVKNGSNRKESIWELTRSKRGRRRHAAEALYWHALKKISLFFKAQ